MSTLDTIERDQERRRRLAVYLILAAALILILGLVGRSLLGGDETDTAQGADGDVEVLSGVMQHADGGGNGGTGGAISTAGVQGQAGGPGTGAGSGPSRQASNGGPGPSGPDAATPGQGQPATPGTGTPAPPDGNPRTFLISVDLDEIYPTYDKGLEVTFSNPHRFAIEVTELSVEVAPLTEACATDLPDDVFTVASLPAGGIPVPPRTGYAFGERSYDLGFEVSHGLPDACQNTTFQLTYAGTAIRANQS